MSHSISSEMGDLRQFKRDLPIEFLYKTPHKNILMFILCAAYGRRTSELITRLNGKEIIANTLIEVDASIM
jgi:hypothetical protein